jgi:hypothetical protein
MLEEKAFATFFGREEFIQVAQLDHAAQFSDL